MAIPTQAVTPEQRPAHASAEGLTPPGESESSGRPGADAPARRRGTRSRAGNAMGRAREAALRGAVLAVAKYGSRKATMGDIAMLAGIAKATLYNHFRTRDDVYRAAVLAEVERIAAAALERAATDGVEAAIAEAARLIAEHPAARRIAADEPATLARLAAPCPATAWDAVRAHVAAAVRGGARDGAGDGEKGAGQAEAGPDDAAATDLIVRYLASLVLAPESAAERAHNARLLALVCAR